MSINKFIDSSTTRSEMCDALDPRFCSDVDKGLVMDRMKATVSCKNEADNGKFEMALTSRRRTSTSLWRSQAYRDSNRGRKENDETG